MIKKLLTGILMLQGCFVFAQKTALPEYHNVVKPVLPITGAKTTASIPETDNYDISYVKFDIALTNTTTYVEGCVTTVAKVTSSTMPVYTFELNATLVIDSIRLNNVLYTAVATGDTRKVTLGSALSSGTTFTVKVYYHGTTTAGTGQFFIHGLNPVNAGGFQMMYSLSDKDLARDWWPVKQEITDKIDSVDMWVTVADTLKVCSNGLLKKTTTLPGNKLRYEWKTIYPIDYYLIMVGVAPYNEYSYYMHYTDGTNDSMLIQNFLYNTPGHFTAGAKASLDSTGFIVDYFSSIYGRYPFDKEKYGHCMSPLSGGMEHQTLTTMGTGAYTDVTLISHELGHQWWGNNVTYGTWKDVWLSEGFASYCEQIFVEHFRGTQAVIDYRKDVVNGAYDNLKSTYVDDTTDTWRIFRTSTTYKKGAMIAHMLRYIAPIDSQYFRALKKYQQQFAKGIAVTTDLQNIFQQEYGTNLDSFFRHWVYGIGYPTYSAKWYQDGNRMVGIQLKQTTAHASVPCYWMPVEIKLKTSSGDRIIRLMNNTNSMTNFIYCDSTVTGIEIDPNYNIVRKVGQIKQDATIMSVANTLMKDITVSPNPTENCWMISNVPVGAIIKLTDVQGRLVWSNDSVTSDIAIPAANLAKGNYLLTVTIGNNSGYKLLVKN